MLSDPTFLAIQVLNGLQLASLLFLLSVGLSVVFGLMNFINLAHGTLYMLGAYIGLSLVRWTGSYWIAFAQTGDPNGGDRPHWPIYSRNENVHMEFADTVETRRHLLKERLDFHESQYEAKVSR